MATRCVGIGGISVLVIVGVGAAALAWARPQPPSVPEPVVITPGDSCGGAPSDAVVLFDGTSLDQWGTADGKPVSWQVEGKRGGAMTVAGGGGSLVSKREFGDCQIHVEFATPEGGTQEGQGRGNSGVYIQGRYEVQILDSFRSSTYPDGQCGAIYKQHAPLVNACRPPGAWQSYDIVFRAPKFDGSAVKEPARITVVHNGVLIQDHAVVRGATGSSSRKEGPGDGPIYLQDHGNPVKFRNIWVRDLK